MPHPKEISNLLDVSAPSNIEDITVTDERSRLRFSVGPKPLLLRHLVLQEESLAAAENSSVKVSVQSNKETGAVASATASKAVAAEGGPSVDIAPHAQSSPSTYVQTTTQAAQGARRESDSYNPAAEVLAVSSSSNAEIVCLSAHCAVATVIR